MSKAKDITSDLVKEVFADALRRKCGPGKAYSVDALADETGIDRRTIDSYRQGQNTPALDKLLRFVAVFGESFLEEVAAPAKQVTGQSDPAGIVTALSEMTSELLHRIHDDGKFCHRDAAHTAPLLFELSGRLESAGHAMRKQAETGGTIHFQAVQHKGKVS
jgi:transcriptional regulator with XRE-family HTH domain